MGSHLNAQQAASKGGWGWSCGRLSYRLVSLTCPRQTHNRWQDRGQRFNLRKGQSWCVSDRRIIAYAPPTVFGTPTSAMKGEGLKDHAVPAHQQERCCMCFELRNGVVCLASLKLAFSILSMMMIDIKDVDLIYCLIVSLIVAIPMNIIGIVGAVKRRKNFVYAYYLYIIVLVYIDLFVVIASIFMPAFTEAQLLRVHELLYRHYSEVGVGLLIQVYFAYVTR